MAHLRDITYTCETYGCSARASVQVYTYQNYPLGRYCKKHGKRMLTEQQALEAHSEGARRQQEGE